MAINWFPGHMHKARKEIKKAMSGIDVVIEVLDARIPFSSANPLVKQLRAEKPCIKILNKADLADPEVTCVWQAELEQEEGVKTLALNANQDCRASTIAQLAKKLAPHANEKDRNLHVMVMGIPNVGKSTLINGLAGKAIAKVGNEPAVTKRQQKINLPTGLALSDTPGILWPKLEPEACGYRLAATGAIRDTAMDHDEVALVALDYLTEAYSEALLERYKLTDLGGPSEDVLDKIGAKRGCLRAGGIVDLHQAATIFLQDFRSGKLGPITLETPDMVERELVELRQKIEAKKAAEDARKSRNK